jgi:uncharacterized protein (UPF0335 family)
MAYGGIDRKRFSQLLEWGTDDDELRRFFADSRAQLILNKGKVQNLPRGKAARIRALALDLPTSTDKVVQKWFAENVTMADPIPVEEAVETLQMYEDTGETLPDDEARRLARSCLMHLFLTEPPEQLLNYLKPPKNAVHAYVSSSSEDKNEFASISSSQPSTEHLSPEFVNALIALAEGKDPDKYLSSLSAPVASLVAGIHAARIGKRDEFQATLEVFTDEVEVRSLLNEFANRTSAAVSSGNFVRGLQFIPMSEASETTTFDFESDEVMAICTNDAQGTVFVRPLAIRGAGMNWISLARGDIRRNIFYASGDVVVFAGRGQRRPLKRGEIGLWRVAQNDRSGPSYQTNFHVTSDKVPVFEVVDVPFPSTDYDSVREYVKHEAEVSVRGSSPDKATLFHLQDGLIVGWPSGRDLTKDEGFTEGLPSWTALPAVRVEGRVLVPGPLPKHDIYECEALASSLRKLFASDKSASTKLTKAQLKTVQELIATGGARIDALRAKRLRSELDVIDEHQGASEVLLEAVMALPKITERVNQLVKAKADALLGEKAELQESIERLKQEKSALAEEQKKLEREQRKMAPDTAKAIRTAFDKARSDAIGTLGQVAVFKALIDEAIERPSPPSVNIPAGVSQFRIESSATLVRQPNGNTNSSATEMLRTLGVTPKYAEALQVVGRLSKDCGLILMIEGLAARLAAEGWLTTAEGSSKLLECRIGLTDEGLVQKLLQEAPANLAVLDANLSPLDVYARPLIDLLQRRIVGLGEDAQIMQVVMSLSDGIAALPVPTTVNSIAIRVALDRRPQFLSDVDAARRVDEIAVSDESAEWISRLWKPAAERVKNRLQALSTEDVALVLSVLDTSP